MPTMSKNPIQGFSLGDERVSSNSPHVPSPPGRHWITLNRILHGMKGEKDVQPWWFSLTKAHTGKWRTWNMREEREIVREKAFMILITKIHNPPSLLFWLRRTFPLRDNNQKKKKEMQKQKERGEIIEDDWGKQNLLLACSLQQNKLRKLVTNSHSIGKRFGNIFHWTADPVLPNPLKTPWVLQDSPAHRGTVNLGIYSLSLNGVFSICLHLSSKLMAKLSRKHRGKPVQFSIFDGIFCLGKWMPVLYLLEFLAKCLENCKCVNQRKVLHVWKVYK